MSRLQRLLLGAVSMAMGSLASVPMANRVGTQVTTAFTNVLGGTLPELAPCVDSIEEPCTVWSVVIAKTSKSLGGKARLLLLHPTPNPYILDSAHNSRIFQTLRFTWYKLAGTLSNL